MAEREKVCVILGAGASYDVLDQPTSRDNKLYRPPLAAGLFNTANSEFDRILDQYPGARYIATVFPDQRSRGKSFEEALSYYADNTDEVVKSHFYHVPPYLHDLLTACSDFYTPDQGCYARTIMELLSVHSMDVLFLILNYDDLLERALAKHDPRSYVFNQTEDYVSPGRAANVIKMHGSVNWYRPIGISKSQSWLETIADPELLVRPKDSEIIVDHGVHRVKDHIHQRTWLYPILTAPVAVKSATEIACTDTHTAFAEEFLSSCRKFLVVGTSGSDADLFHLIGRASAGVPAELVHFVGKGSETQEALDRFQNGVDVFPSSVVKIFTNGFQHYVNHDLRSFSETT